MDECRDRWTGSVEFIMTINLFDGPSKGPSRRFWVILGV